MENKFFEVRFEGMHVGVGGGPWILVTRTPTRAFLVVFEEKEVAWLLELLKKFVELKGNLGFIRKFRGKLRTHLMEICFSSKEDSLESQNLSLAENLPFLLFLKVSKVEVGKPL